MSDFTILEITDSSILSDVGLESNKRRYIDDEVEKGETSSSKKFKDEEEKQLSDCEQENTGQGSSEKNKNKDLNKSDESTYMLDEIESIVDNSTIEEKIESNDERYSDQEEEEDEQSSESDDSSDNYDDDALMVRAMKASNNLPENDEPIELDDSESSINDELEHSELKSSGANDTTQESNEEEETDPIHEYSLRKRMLRYNPRFYLSRLLVKKSIRILKKKSVKLQKKPDEIIPIVKNDDEDIVPMDIDEGSKETRNDCLVKVNEKTCEQEELPLSSGDSKSVPAVNLNETEEPHKNNTENKEEEILDSVIELQRNKPLNDNEPVTENSSISKERTEDTNSNSIDKIQTTNCNNQKQEKEDCTTLLTEISNSSIEEMMNRYVLRTSASEQDISIEDFTEDLFICLQQNKQEIVKVQKEWNEKLHVKYKIRELMERIRRHRTVVEIESFGFKPSQDSFNRVISSKSSTTNSENDHFEKSSRMSSESVSRLIQDVRANVLKREDKQRVHLSNIGDPTIYDESSSFSLSSHMQPNQGRQGQIIDVQSIINDFRQKNPQEVPRRGRRVKNSYTNNSVLSENHHIFSPFNRMEMNSRTNDTNTTSKTNNSSGFPEVSLLPVSNFYKNLSQSVGNSQIGQKSSLLQSILTKSTKNNFQNINSGASSTSTLARLLTAPERDRKSQNTSRSMHMNDARQSNGEITITPIAGTVRKHEFSMDDEDDDDSNEAPLVIDEPEELDSSNRNKSGEMLLCQGCRRNKALFMCAGCSKQWYCSKECQEVAWDNHAESCMV